MRKDVKLGFAIGGVLLAVLIVYVIAVSGSSDKKQVVQADGADKTAANDGAKVSLEPVDGTGSAPSVPPVPPPAPAAQFDPGSGGSTDPFAPGGSDTTKPAETVAQATGPSSGGRRDDWNKILNEQLVLMTETPTAQGRNATGTTPPATAAPESAPKAPEPVAQAPAVPPIATEAAPTPGNTSVATTPPSAEPAATPPIADASLTQVSPPPTVQPAGNTTMLSPNGGREHVVQIGETFTSISMAAYGNANYYPHIQRANPTIDPTRLRPGTRIILPDISTVRPQAAVTAQPASASIPAAAPAAPLDATKQYRVQAGDSLHKIALTLYGQSTNADRIYQLNKQSIGEDPHRLKIGQVLQLPEPPKAAGSQQAAR